MLYLEHDQSDVCMLRVLFLLLYCIRYPVHEEKLGTLRARYPARLPYKSRYRGNFGYIFGPHFFLSFFSLIQFIGFSLLFLFSPTHLEEGYLVPQVSVERVSRRNLRRKKKNKGKTAKDGRSIFLIAFSYKCKSCIHPS